jgi:hypothetical protein
MAAASRPWPPTTSATSPTWQQLLIGFRLGHRPPLDLRYLVSAPFCPSCSSALWSWFRLWVYEEGCPLSLCSDLRWMNRGFGEPWAGFPRGLAFLVRLGAESPNLSCKEELASSERFHWTLFFVTQLARFILNYHSYSIWQNGCLNTVS